MEVLLLITWVANMEQVKQNLAKIAVNTDYYAMTVPNHRLMYSSTNYATYRKIQVGAKYARTEKRG